MGTVFALNDTKLKTLVSIAESESVGAHVVLNKILEATLSDKLRLAAQRDGVNASEAVLLAIGLYCDGIRLDGSERDAAAIQSYLTRVTETEPAATD